MKSESDRVKGRRPVDWTAEPDEPTGESPRNAGRRLGREAADEATVLADRVVEVNDLTFAQLPLDDELAALCRRARGMRRDSGQRRTIREISMLLRMRDRRPLQAAFLRIEAGKGALAESFHALERWRDRLINEGDGALDALLAVQPGADRQALRTLARQARKERDAEQTPRAARELFKLLRDLEWPETEAT